MRRSVVLLLVLWAGMAQAGSLYDAIRHPWQAYMAVSLDMPDAHLAQLARESRQAGVPLVVAGFARRAPTLEATRRRMAAINVLCCGAKGGTQWLIYPQLFKQYQVEQVPSFLLIQQGRQDAAGFVKVTGDIGIADALKRIAQQSQLPAMREAAGRVYARFAK